MSITTWLERAHMMVGEMRSKELFCEEHIKDLVHCLSVANAALGYVEARNEDYFTDKYVHQRWIGLLAAIDGEDA